MAILNTDIQFRLSGGASNAVPDASLGGVKSSVSIVDATIHNLFDVVSSAEALAGDVEYRCFYLHNAHATLTLQASKIWIQTNTPDTTTSADIGLAAAAVNATETAVANESTAPASVTFSNPVNEAGALTIGDIPAGQHKAIWVRRTINASSPAFNSDSVVIRVKGDTAA
jgi:hypothetical protein